MNVQETFREYIWLLNTIRKARKITFDKIQEKCADSTSKCKFTKYSHKNTLLVLKN